MQEATPISGNVDPVMRTTAIEINPQIRLTPLA